MTCPPRSGWPALAQAIGSQLPSAGRMSEPVIDSARASLGPESVAALLAEGKRTSPIRPPR